jgi:hypothetical protein
MNADSSSTQPDQKRKEKGQRENNFSSQKWFYFISFQNNQTLKVGGIHSKQR